MLDPISFNKVCTKKGAQDKYFRDIIYVMSTVKSKIGCGTPIVVHFFADVLSTEADDLRVEYNYKALGDDVELIRKDEHRYCLKQVYKMCYYVQKLYHQEILRMKAIFVKDENESIWFHYATDIWARENETAKMAMEF